MTTPTTNMNWTDPTVGSSSDVWGDLTNAIWDNLDAHTAGILYGLTLSAAGSTATFGVASGAASGMVLATAYTKTTSVWGVGTGQGALDTGSIANSTWYHAYLIQRTDTGVVDILVSTSATAPTMPTNYTRKRRIGAMKTDGSAQWVKFYQDGDDFWWDVPVADIAASNPGTSAVLRTLSVPTGARVRARISAGLGTGIDSTVYLSPPDIADTAANFIGGVGQLTVHSSSTPLLFPMFPILTNTSGQIRSRLSGSDASVTLYIFTAGWGDTRGK